MVFSNRIAERKKLFQVKLQSSFSNKQVFFFSYGGGGGEGNCILYGDRGFVLASTSCSNQR